jgi:large subunit ribosomal protein L10
MALNLSQKQEVVAELADVAAKAHSLVAAEYAGTTVSQMTAMRKKARETGVYLRVVKNTLASRAVAGTEYEVVQDKLVGPLLYAFSTEEPGAAGRLIKEFAKGNDKLKAQVVAMGGQLYPASHVEVLASLPTLQQALAMLARVLTEPVTMFARAVKAVGELQGGGAVAEEAATEASAPEAAAPEAATAEAAAPEAATAEAATTEAATTEAAGPEAASPEAPAETA